MTEYSRAKLIDDISSLASLISPSQDRTKFKYDPDNKVLMCETAEDAKFALENGGISFEMSGVKGAIDLIHAERKQALRTVTGKLKTEINCFITGDSIPVGTEITMLEMDREFYILDGPFWTVDINGTRSESHFAANSGTPGDFLAFKKGDTSRIFRLPREWALSEVA